MHVASQRTLTEKQLVQKLHKILGEADIIVAHNGDEFDAKKARAKFVEFGLPALPPSQQIDTKKIAKRHFRFSSNSLNNLGELLGVGKKMPTGGFDLWLDCMAGKIAAWKKMEAYNKQDVLLLERVYLKLRPWVQNHPNVAAGDKPSACPKCGTDRPLHFRGYRRMAAGSYRRYQCRDCGAWSRSRTVEKGSTKADIV